MVEDVIGFCAQRHCVILMDAELLIKRNVQVGVAWPPEGVDPRSADLPSRGKAKCSHLGLGKVVDATGSDPSFVYLADVSVT